MAVWNIQEAQEDIVVRLRAETWVYGAFGGLESRCASGLNLEAAAVIDNLRKVVARLQKCAPAFEQ